MELILVIIVTLLLFIGVLGCFIPVIPGPIISYSALLISELYIFNESNINILIYLAVIVVSVTILDFVCQIYGVKTFGGSKRVVNGSIFGLLIGMFFFSGFGFLIGTFLGAFLASITELNFKNSLKVAVGSLFGFIVGTLLKLSVSLYIIYYIYSSIINS